jgi:hypothetical protein
VKREEEMARMNAGQGGEGGAKQLMFHEEGKPPRALSMEEIHHLIQSQQSQIEYLNRHIQGLEKQMDVLYSNVTRA